MLVISNFIIMNHEKNRHVRGGKGSSNSSCQQWKTPKLSIGIITHGEGVIYGCSDGAL